MHEEYINRYQKIALEIDADFADESSTIKNQETKRIRISKSFKGTRIDFMAIDQKIRYLNRVCYVRPFSGIFIPIDNKFDYELEIISKFGFDFLKEKFSKKYMKSSFSDFNKKFLIRCNEPVLLKNVLQNKDTREVLKNNRTLKLGIAKKDSTFANQWIANQSFFYIEQDHWIDNSRTINDLLHISGSIVPDLINARLIELTLV